MSEAAEVSTGKLGRLLGRAKGSGVRTMGSHEQSSTVTYLLIHIFKGTFVFTSFYILHYYIITRVPMHEISTRGSALAAPRSLGWPS